jgi:predicted nucleic acid-binding protein
MMPTSSKTIIVDASCFILLDKISELSILQLLWDEVETTMTVIKEFGKPLPEWVIVKDVENKTYQKILEIEVGKGEASTIALGLEIADTLLVLDDWKARKLAEKLGLQFTGTFGLIIKAKKTGKISSVKPILEKIQNTNFRFSQAMINEVLKESGELFE